MKTHVITGSNSMLGKHLYAELCRLYPDDPIVCLTHDDCDLLEEKSQDIIARYKPDNLFHLAGYNGNLKFTQQHSLEIYQQNAQMALNIMGAMVKLHRKGYLTRLFNALPSCMYFPKENLIEKDIISGPPHKSVMAHGFAKRHLYEVTKLINSMYMKSCFNVVFNTIYGPYDNYDINKTKVMGGLIKKFVDARLNGDESVELWGTGKAVRGFIFAADAAKILADLSKNYNKLYIDGLDLINAPCHHCDIKTLANTIKDLTHYNGEITYNGADDGQILKILDYSKYERIMGNFPMTSLEDGIKLTLKWYKTIHD